VTHYVEFQNTTVKYNLESTTVSLDEVYFPSMTVCNMNILRRSFIGAILEDEGISKLGVEFGELKKLIYSVFIFGGDYTPSDRDNEIIQSNIKDVYSMFSYILSIIQRSYSDAKIIANQDGLNLVFGFAFSLFYLIFLMTDL
jgi:hypothetical protein